jgi:hypothetical protein
MSLSTRRARRAQRLVHDALQMENRSGNALHLIKDGTIRR